MSYYRKRTPVSYDISYYYPNSELIILIDAVLHPTGSVVYKIE